jgi:outer membrane protein OmpA-like peptidoglycan-associated protein
LTVALRPRKGVASSTLDERPARQARWLIPLLICLSMFAACAGTQLEAGVAEVRQQAALARKNGAMRCAPRELALVDANAAFADGELGEGDYFRAREHLQIAEDNAREALRRSVPDRCIGASDRDHDGIPDEVDKCPNDAEDKDGFEDTDGCPDPDNDGDGIADEVDKCPNDAEDKDGFEDTDGCPDPDNDKDGVVDAEDKCPLQPGPASSNGCPKTYDNIVVTDQKIELKQKIFFATNQAIILPRSDALLAEIASVLRSRPTMRLRIEGHTDTQGARKRNMSLSQARADAVRIHLEKLGITAARLEAVGYGPDQPIETNRTTAGREKNRRVEFVIVQQ